MKDRMGSRYPVAGEPMEEENRPAEEGMGVPMGDVTGASELSRRRWSDAEEDMPASLRVARRCKPWPRLPFTEQQRTQF